MSYKEMMLEPASLCQIFMGYIQLTSTLLHVLETSSPSSALPSANLPSKVFCVFICLRAFSCPFRLLDCTPEPQKLAASPLLTFSLLVFWCAACDKEKNCQFYTGLAATRFLATGGTLFQRWWGRMVRLERLERIAISIVHYWTFELQYKIYVEFYWTFFSFLFLCFPFPYWYSHDERCNMFARTKAQNFSVDQVFPAAAMLRNSRREKNPAKRDDERR